jgi:hypothetical protein
VQRQGAKKISRASMFFGQFARWTGPPRAAFLPPQSWPSGPHITGPLWPRTHRSGILLDQERLFGKAGSHAATAELAVDSHWLGLPHLRRIRALGSRRPQFQRHLGGRRHYRWVLTGAIPSYFFKQQSDKATAKATALAGIADPTEYKTLMADHPELR